MSILILGRLEGKVGEFEVLDWLVMDVGVTANFERAPEISLGLQLARAQISQNRNFWLQPFK